MHSPHFRADVVHTRAPQQMTMGQGIHIGLQMLHATTRASMKEVEDEELRGALIEAVGAESNKVFEIVDTRMNYPILIAKENASFLERNFMCAECRPYRFEVFSRKSQGEILPMLRINRPLSCKIGSRSMKVYDAETGRLFGRIQHLHSCSKIAFRVNNSEGQMIFEVGSHKCSGTKIMGKMPCGPCKSHEFDVIDRHGKHLGAIRNEWTGCFDEMLGKDEYTFNFEQVSDADEKALLVATAIYIDMRYFTSSLCNWNVRDCLVKRYLGPAAKAGKAAKLVPVARHGAKFLQEEKKKRAH
ncbi:MAG: uncharacterized protein KVP18_005010 [Porospora cf. gigantea A]|uniref:uncharacterized protein n=2 Tax=Porospora cf. gigantea A TaxID=2853593 RepID=UPI00355A60E7|nr:MAG: hypothetical protein KVP18_005010 [Porospora cf. gigantea A]